MSVSPLKSALPKENLRLQLVDLTRNLSPKELCWASGYLAALADQSHLVPALVSPNPQVATNHWKIFYATETGNSRGIAEALAGQLTSKGLRATAIDLAEYGYSQFKKETHAIFVLATHGIGEVPEGTEEFFEYLLEGIPGALNRLNFSVLALGDSSYVDFCEVGRRVDQRLEELGATRLHDRLECDLDFDEDAERWQQQILNTALDSEESADVQPTGSLVSLEGSFFNNNHPTIYSRTNPLEVTLTKTQQITGGESSKVVHHVVMEAEALVFEPGDSLGVWPTNPPQIVEPIINLLNLEGDDEVKLGDTQYTLREALAEKLELTQLGRSFIAAYAEKYEIEALIALLHENSRTSFEQLVNTHQIIDVLRLYPAPVSAQQLVSLLRKISPRLYSIASSSQANPEEVHLTVADVRYTAFENTHYGTASTYINELPIGATTRVYVAPNPRFRLPGNDETPIIMIGAGTGVAPFRAFLQEREATQATGKNWLIFGDRNFHTDFLYQIEWARYRKSGVLTRHDVAFSRDQLEKDYVQDRIRENATEIQNWLHNGATVYVCGDATHMAPDVESAFVELLANAHNGERAKGAADLQTLKTSGRYSQDVY